MVFIPRIVILLVICYVTLLQAFSLSMKQFSRTEILSPFTQGKALKIISGLHNFDEEIVKHVVWAANSGGGSHVDIACRPDLVKMAKKIAKNIPVCVSGVNPLEFVDAVNAGADMIEIGNFDSFYEQGIQFTAKDVIHLTKETKRLLPSIPLSVTVPHTLSLAEQVSLAKELEACGADIIQTEGKLAANLLGTRDVQELIELAAPTLASAYVLSRTVKIPVMCASGLNDITSPMALAAGAKGVGIGSMVNKLNSPQQMLLAVSAIAVSMGRSPQQVEVDADTAIDMDMSVDTMSTFVKKVGQ